MYSCKEVAQEPLASFSILRREEVLCRAPGSASLVHERDVRFGGEIHNNKMERLNGEIRDREKVVRGVKKSESPLIKGLQIYHNYVRPHMSLEGRTPASVAGIEVLGENKWQTIIQNASRKREPSVSAKSRLRP